MYVCVYIYIYVCKLVCPELIEETKFPRADFWHMEVFGAWFGQV